MPESAVIELDEQDVAEFDRLDATVRRGSQVFIEVGEALSQIKARQLWKARYPTWEAYCQDAVGYTVRRVDQYIAASNAAAVIENVRSENPSLPSPQSEYQMRPVAGKADEEVVKVWESATQAYGDRPTNGQVAMTAQREEAVVADGVPKDDPVRRQVYGAKVAMVIQRMNEGVLTPKQALAVCDAIESCTPKVRGQLLLHGVLDPVVIRELYRLFKARSETYDEIVASGYLQFADERAIPVGEAKASDLRDLLDEKRQEHMRRSMAEKDALEKVTSVNLTVWVGGDEETLKRTIQALERALGVDRLKRICEVVLGR